MTKLRTQLAGSQLNTVVLLFMVFFTGVLFRLLVVPWSSFPSGDPPGHGLLRSAQILNWPRKSSFGVSCHYLENYIYSSPHVHRCCGCKWSQLRWFSVEHVAEILFPDSVCTSRWLLLICVTLFMLPSCLQTRAAPRSHDQFNIFSM